jgi:hypothetical protein
MTSMKTTTSSTASRPACGYPGCDQAAAQPGGPGRPARVLRRARPHQLAAEKTGTTISAADDASPVTMAKVGGAQASNWRIFIAGSWRQDSSLDP